MDITSGKRWRTEEKVPLLREPELFSEIPLLSSNPRTFGNTINPALHDNVLLPEGFTEYIYHVGNGIELRPIVNHGLIPEGVSLKTGRHAVFCTVVNLMDNQDGLGETPMRLIKSKNRAIQKYLETLSRYSISVQFEARSTKRTANLSNKIKRSYSLRHTACMVH